MLKESDFKKYFEGNISPEELMDKIQSKEIERTIPEAPHAQDTPRRTKIMYDNEFHDLGMDGFILTRKHLIKLCKDFLEERITAWNLEDIALILYGCDGFVWGSDEEERELIADAMHNFSSPEINCPLIKENVKKFLNNFENK